MRRFILLIAVAILSSLSQVVCATQKGRIEFNMKINGVKMDFQILSLDEKTVQLCGVPSSTTELIIPNSVEYKGNKFDVTTIGNDGRSICDQKVKVTMAGLAFGALAGSAGTKVVDPKLRKVTIPLSVKKIEEYAFANCTNLEEVVFPESTKMEIGGLAFYGCSRLKFNTKFIADLNKVKGIDADTAPEVASASNSLSPLLTNESPAAANNPMVTKSTPEQSVSDVDVNIPQTFASNENAFSVIICNENYQDVSKVPNALNDGLVFAEYCHKTLGMPKSNVHLVKDATLNNMRRELSWLTQVTEAYKGTASVIFYYAGHGIPDEKTKSAYILPVDGYGTDVATGFSLSELYASLGKLQTKQTVVLLDACFSGSLRGEGMLSAARGVAIKAKAEAPQGQMVILSAAQGDETAYPYVEKSHGLFTYYLLKKLQESKGQATLDELSSYITDNVTKKSIVVNGKSQTPNISAPASIGNGWKKWTLK